MMMVQAPVPLHDPDQPVKPDPLAGTAVSVTDVSWLKFAAQSGGHAIPGGLLVIVPTPCPEILANRDCTGTKFAVTVCGELRVTMHTSMPVQADALHPANAEPADGVAVSVTAVPLS